MNLDRPTSDPGPEATDVPRRRLVLAVAVVATVVALAGYLLVSTFLRPVERAAAPAGDVVAIHDPGVVFRNEEGIVVTVPRGLAQQRHPFELAPIMAMTVGQRIEVRNEDEIAHVVFGMVVPPGGSKTMTLDRAGILVYSSGCAAHVSGSGLTTVMVSDPEGNP